MMEFTLTRALMFACGIMVLAASLSPVAHIYGSRCGSVTMEQCDMVADMVDSFMGSGLDSIVIQCSDIIPDGCVLYVDDGIIVIIRDADIKPDTVAIGINAGILPLRGYSDIPKLFVKNAF